MNAKPLVYVYAFCWVPAAPLELPQGIAAPTILVQAGALGAIAETDLDIATLKDNDQQLMTAILTHDRVLCDVFAQTTLLPLRFGTQFAGNEALHQHLQHHQQTYCDRLQTLRGQAEYLIKLTPRPLDVPPPEDNVKGREYFLAKKRRLQAQADAQAAQRQQFETLLSHLEQSCPALIHDAPQAEQERLHLLAGRDGQQLDRTLTTGQALAPDWEIQRSEPLPPYHFTQ